MLLEGVEERGAGWVGSRAGRSTASPIVDVSGAAGESTVGVIAGVRGGSAGPAEGNIVLARKAGFIVDGETDLIGEDAGEIGGGLIGGPVEGRTAKDDSTAVVVRFGLSGSGADRRWEAGVSRWIP